MEEELDNGARPPHPSEVPTPEGQHGPHTLAGFIFPGKRDNGEERGPLSRRESYASQSRLDEPASSAPSPSKSRRERKPLRGSAAQSQGICPPSTVRERSNSMMSDDAGSVRSRLVEDASTPFDEDAEEQSNLENMSGSRSRARAAEKAKSNTDNRQGHDAESGSGQWPWYGISRMQKFSLYETATRFYLVGMDLKERRFRILKIERTSENEELHIYDDDMLYSKKEVNQILDAVDDGNKVSGGLKLRCCTWGLLGLIRFTGTYYMLLITKRSQVAMLGGHFIYQIDGTELIPLSSSITGKTRSEKAADEARFLTIMNNLDLTRSFYFSYSYDLTRTLQFNITKAREAVQRGTPENNFRNVNSMFEWNQYLLQPVVPLLKNPYDWCFPIIHGYVDQASISVFGRLVYVTLIARRSRYFAGARFLKRGANDLGYVANDVETEQIVSDTLTTSFHGPGPKLYANPRYTSYVQHRGSIPLYWSQDSNGVAPKPDIEMNLVDPFYSAAALHFDNLFERYGAPVYVLNLVKSRERVPRESKLLHEYTDAIRYLNQFLPNDKKIVYKAFDMSRAAKSRDQDVILSLENIAEDIIPRTSLFKNGDTFENGLMLQNGVARTNCIDCLDRTNAAQFVIGKRALGHQLYALGIIDTTSIDYDTDAVNMITNMWHHHGDTIAVQYGGSQLVNTMATYRKTNQWTGQSRDMVESFKRYYNNSFLDAQRQEAYNLFLGNYVYTPDEPMLWDLSTDYYLHHSSPKHILCLKRRSYIDWFTPEFLEKKTMPEVVYPAHNQNSEHHAMRSKNVQNPGTSSSSDDGDEIGRYDDYWMEYYRPLGMTLFQKTFSFKMKSTSRYLPAGYAATTSTTSRYDMSPFVPRVVLPDNYAADAKKNLSRKKEVTIKDPLDGTPSTPGVNDDTRSISSAMTEFSTAHKPLAQWLQNIPSSSASHADNNYVLQGIMKSPHLDIKQLPPLQATAETPSEFRRGRDKDPSARSRTPSTRAAVTSLEDMVSHTLHPTVSNSESEEYERYVNHPLKVPLVVTSEDTLPPASLPENNPSIMELIEYMDHSLLEDVNLDALAEENLLTYNEYVNVRSEGLSVLTDDYVEKRYRLYEGWLKGKNVLKQRVDA